jgi:hypothetical protein
MFGVSNECDVDPLIANKSFANNLFRPIVEFAYAYVGT